MLEPEAAPAPEATPCGGGGHALDDRHEVSTAASSRRGDGGGVLSVDPLIAAVPQVTLGGLPIAITDCATAADMLVDLALSRRGTFRPPAIVTSANGQVLSLCARDREVRRLFEACDIRHADGMPLVFASYLQRRASRLPERVATTDLFHSVARIAIRRRVSFYMLGSTAAGMDRASAHVRRLYPDLDLVGAHHGYLDEAGAAEQVRRIAQVRPDILWIGMGVPREQRFALRWREALAGVGVIKTSGGLFDFLSGAQRRAPSWMQQAGLEWVFRAVQEPDRLMLRYVTTSPHALYLLLTRGD